MIPGVLFGKPRKTAPSKRIIMGGIGMGGQGLRDLQNFIYHDDVQMVAVCDVSAEHRAQAKALVDEAYGNTDCAVYRDFRELLAREDIEVVFIATGERWHGIISAMAARAGKDVYCEKPSSMSIGESRDILEIISSHNRIYQCGTQRRSQWAFRYAADVVRAGKLGTLRTVYAHCLPYGWRKAPPGEEPVPPVEELDWDLWLGPAPVYPYSKMLFNNWRRIRGLSDPGISEWGAHTMDLCQLANNSDHTSPTHYVLTGKYVTATYENGVQAKLTAPPNYHKGHGVSIRFDGDEGWFYVDDGGVIEAQPESLMKEFREIRTRTWKDLRNWRNHQRNFLDCVRSRQQPASNPRVTHRAITACHLAVICHETGQSVQWDPVKEVIVDGSPKAKALLRHTYRKPWKI